MRSNNIIYEDNEYAKEEKILELRKKSKKRRLYLVAFSFFIALIPLGFFLFLGGCESDQKDMLLVLEKDDQKYIYHNNKSALNFEIQKASVPSPLKVCSIFEYSGDYFLSVQSLKPFCTIASGNYELISYPQTSFEGYVVDGDFNTIETEIVNVPTEKISKMKEIRRVTLTDTIKSEPKFIIEWEQGESLKAIKNCEVKSVYVVKNIVPGETHGSYEDQVLVPVNKILDFYGNTYKIKVDADEGVVYLVEK